MLNFTTKKEYQGTNIDELMASGFDMGSEFCTFIQAVNYFKLESGKLLKGAKSCARLRKIVKKEVFNKLTGKKEQKKVPVFFSVFEKKHLEQIITANEGVA
mgnify:CR=1 FL=1